MIDYTIDYIKAHDFSTGPPEAAVTGQEMRLLLLSENFATKETAVGSRTWAVRRSARIAA